MSPPTYSLKDMFADVADFQKAMGDVLSQEMR